MIARTWRGAVRTDGDSDAYAEYMEATGVAGYRAVPGDRGVWMLRRDLGDGLTEFVMFTLLGVDRGDQGLRRRRLTRPRSSIRRTTASSSSAT